MPNHVYLKYILNVFWMQPVDRCSNYNFRLPKSSEKQKKLIFAQKTTKTSG